MIHLEKNTTGPIYGNFSALYGFLSTNGVALAEHWISITLPSDKCTNENNFLVFYNKTIVVGIEGTEKNGLV